jgi:hypothetical protein
MAFPPEVARPREKRCKDIYYQRERSDPLPLHDERPVSSTTTQGRKLSLQALVRTLASIVRELKTSLRHVRVRGTVGLVTVAFRASDSYCVPSLIVLMRYNVYRPQDSFGGETPGNGKSGCRLCELGVIFVGAELLREIDHVVPQLHQHSCQHGCDRPHV